MSARATIWKAADGLHIDVRGLPPPEPMIAILERIDAGDSDVILVHHERNPVMLYDELAARGWNAAIEHDAPGDVRLRLSRARG